MGNACGCGDNRTAIEKQIDQTLLMLKRPPNLTKYALSKERNLCYTKAWNSVYFGGSVTNPLGAVAKKRNRKNPTEELIKAL